MFCHSLSLRTKVSLTLIVGALALSACSTTAPSSSSPISGQGAAEKASTEAIVQRNKQNATAFYNQFFNDHDLSAADRYISDTTYIQHNPHVPNGREPFKNTFAQIFQQNPQRHSKIVRVIGDGDLVALHVHSTMNADDRGSAIVDIFRFDVNGKIVEHWDVIQPIPEKTASGNGLF